MPATPRSKLLASVKDLLLSGNFSDFVLTCGRDTYHVHKAIICPQSRFLNNAIKFGGKEAQDGKLELHDDDPAIVKLLVQYFYESDYLPALASDVKWSLADRVNYLRDTNPKNPNGRFYCYNFPHHCYDLGYDCRYDAICPHHVCTATTCHFLCSNFNCRECTVQTIQGPANQLITHAKVYEIADKYAVAELKELAKQKFSSACEFFWMDLAFPQAAHHAFTTTVEEDMGLRDIVARTIAKNITLILRPEIKGLMNEYHGLALQVLLEEHGWKRN